MNSVEVETVAMGLVTLVALLGLVLVVREWVVNNG